MKNRGGFTIIESMIALAVSSTLLVMMMVMFNGRQARVEFSQGMRDIEANILDIANDVRTGYYPSVSSQKCTVSSGSIVFIDDSSSQGTSSECVFAGKVLLFDNSSVPSLVTYSLAGIKNSDSLMNLKPTPVGINGDETKTDYTLPGGISLVKNDLSKTSVLVGLVFDISSVGVGSTDTKKISGIVPYKLNLTGGTGPINIKTATLDTSGYTTITADGINLCFMGANGKMGYITIIRGPDGLSTSLYIDKPLNGITCTTGV